MVKYEYHIMTGVPNLDDHLGMELKLMNFLDEYGEEGWQLVFFDRRDRLFIFKRKIE